MYEGESDEEEEGASGTPTRVTRQWSARVTAI